ncbi:MAG: hypothetical protein ACXVNP_10140 [Bacteroidia bacterium]
MVKSFLAETAEDAELKASCGTLNFKYGTINLTCLFVKAVRNITFDHAK